MTHPYFDVERPTILGHRGAAGVVPENTLMSFAQSLADGAHIIESDIQSTREGVPILMHDAKVDRTTDGEGPANGFDLEALRRLDAGHGFEDASGKTPFRGQSIRVPTLREAFEAFPEARFNLEVKAPGIPLMEQIVSLIVEFDRQDRTLLVAGENSIQAELRQVLASTGATPALGASLADILDVVGSAVDRKAPTTDSMALQIPREFAGQPLVTSELVRHCHAHGIVVHVWTINDPDEMRDLLEIGVDGIVTDVPGRMAELLRAP